MTDSENLTVEEFLAAFDRGAPRAPATFTVVLRRQRVEGVLEHEAVVYVGECSYNATGPSLRAVLQQLYTQAGASL